MQQMSVTCENGKGNGFKTLPRLNFFTVQTFLHTDNFHNSRIIHVCYLNLDFKNCRKFIIQQHMGLH